MRADFVSIVLCGPTNGCEDCDAEANDGGGQHDPVYGDSTVFVAVEGLDQVKQFHGLSPVFKFALRVSTSTSAGKVRPCPCWYGVNKPLVWGENLSGIVLFQAFHYFQ